MLFVRCSALVLALSCAIVLSSARAAEADADGDGFSDPVEKAFGTDPNSAASTPYGGQPAGPGTPIAKGGARVFLDFSNTQPDNMTVFGDLDIPNVPTDVDGRKVAIDLGGFVRLFTLDENGHSETPQAIIDVRKNAGGLHFIMTAQTPRLETLYGEQGLNNADASLKTVSLDLTVFAGKKKYFIALPGLYNAKAGKSGVGFLGAISEDAKLKKPRSKITSVKVTPNPATAGTAVTFKGDVSIKELTGNVVGNLAFGDKSDPIRVDGDTLQSMLKTGIQHTYAVDGVYEARLGFGGDNEVLATKLFVVVGKQFIVNPLDGSITKIEKTGTGNVTLTHLVDNVPDATNAMTTFRDQQGQPVGVPKDFLRAATAPNPADPQTGLNVGRVFSFPGIYVAEVVFLNAEGKPAGKVRKTITINGGDLGMSGTADAATVRDAAPRADGATDGTIDLSNIKGKFLFTSAKQDKVLFSGSFTLPVGYNPKQTGGNDITMGMGNVIDTIHLNEKGKFVAPSSLGRVTKFTLRVPRLATGVATGTEVAKVSMTMNVADLDILGFDSEGITASVRSDEADQTTVQRFIQVDMLVSGSTFTVLSSVEFKVDSNSEFGSISGRANSN